MLKSKITKEKKQEIEGWLNDAVWMTEWHRGKVLGMLDALQSQGILTTITRDLLVNEMSFETQYAERLKGHLVSFLEEDGDKNA